jgi:hypothetical protein
MHGRPTAPPSARRSSLPRTSLLTDSACDGAADAHERGHFADFPGVSSDRRISIPQRILRRGGKRAVS